MKEEARKLLTITTVLICIGIVMVYSSSSCYAYENFYDSAYYLKRHVLHFIIGIVLGFFAFKADFKKLKRHSRTLLALSILALVLVLVPGIGREAGGARRWIRIGALGFQHLNSQAFF